jgi:hypothetical protein
MPDVLKKLVQKFTYKPKFGLVVVCSDEGEQRLRFSHLKRLVWKVKVVVV